ncbi:MAG: 30S ribosome-binding factor RbfA [Planctomycetota bacterium]|nr:30S ribosome-binding factor RbfA [Planctomycetota bacterium]
MTNRHTEQLTAAIDRAVREVLARGLQDPRVSGLITVTEVRLSPDLREADIGVTVLPLEKEPLTLHGLQSAAAHIRREVGDLVHTRQMPVLRFRADHTVRKQAALLRDLDRARADLEARERGSSGEEATS